MNRTTPAHARCRTCRMRFDLCLCSLVPRLEVATRVIVLMHQAEKDKTTNTAHLAGLSLTNFEIRIRGELDSPMSTEDLSGPGASTLLLFPEPGARELTPELVAGLTRPITLIVPDGTWRQATKIARRVRELDSVPRVRLPQADASNFWLRKRIREGGVCTIEAIARALGVLEGPPVQEALEEIFLTMVKRTLWSRCSSGFLKTDMDLQSLLILYKQKGGYSAPAHL